MNRVVENLRSHLDAVVIHIGSHELTDAAHSIGPATSRDSIASVAGSVATVTSRQVLDLCHLAELFLTKLTYRPHRSSKWRHKIEVLNFSFRCHFHGAMKPTPNRHQDIIKTKFNNT